MPLVCQVVSGEQADDGYTCRVNDETVRVLGRSDVLVVGDAKWRPGNPGAPVGGGSLYLCAYRPVGNRTAMTDWADEALADEADWEPVQEVDPQTGELRPVAYLYAGQREQRGSTPIPRWRHLVGTGARWYEPSRCAKTRRTQHERCIGWNGLLALRRPIAKGRRRYRTQADLQTVLAALLKRYDLVGLVTVTLVKKPWRRVPRAGLSGISASIPPLGRPISNAGLATVFDQRDDRHYENPVLLCTIATRSFMNTPFPPQNPSSPYSPVFYAMNSGLTVSPGCCV